MRDPFFIPAKPAPVVELSDSDLVEDAPSRASIAPVAAGSRPPPPAESHAWILVVVATLVMSVGTVGFALRWARAASKARASVTRITHAEPAIAPPSAEPVEVAALASTPVDTLPLIAPAPPPKIVIVPSPRESLPQARGTGTIRTFSAAAGKSISVDGKVVGAAPTPVTVVCGPHTVKLGSGAARKVNVPCSSAVTLGDPDGN